ncbi:EAL domain-containing protein [Alkalihalobacillus oceani]|uniref:EAL domain-containing protein n=1 Tax=Halalkalibacter oceani TaxID=1653776 RepID=UPI00203F7668|nr:EAL-associated domain-containing protein [Halalkalibacter oceani]MCM3760715.1 EAL domain-containing protein [Halalkalibacter oceani]
MDPLDVMMNKQLIRPYFQPIISADKQLVVGYDVLAKLETDEGVKGFDDLLEDKSIPDEYRLELNEYLQRGALDVFVTTDQTSTLFFAYDIELLYKDNAETFIRCLESYQQYDLNHHQIVLKLKESEIVERISEYKHFFAYIQSTGIRIAIDEVGKTGSYLDRIAMLKPNIVKVNVAFLDEDALPHLYREVHHSLSMLSRKIGATLLFDGITNFNQLNYAWRNGGRYYQGSYLQGEKADFVEADCCKEKMQKEFQHFIVYERKKMEAQLALTNELNQQLKQVMKMMNPEDTYDEMIMKVAKECDGYAFRVYLCNAEGFQQSSNAEKNAEKSWVLREEGRFKNWSWRPYFLENIVRMNIEKRGFLSDLYTDIDRDERIRTYSYPISEDLYLFLDIPYDYLFEQEGLL